MIKVTIGMIREQNKQLNNTLMYVYDTYTQYKSHEFIEARI